MSQTPTLQAVKSCLCSQQEIFEIYNDLLSCFKKQRILKSFYFLFTLSIVQSPKKIPKYSLIF